MLPVDRVFGEFKFGVLVEGTSVLPVARFFCEEKKTIEIQTRLRGKLLPGVIYVRTASAAKAVFT